MKATRLGRGRVGAAVTRRASHRSGRAQLTHPVRQRAGWQRPSLHWVLRGEFPSFDGTMALCDYLCPSRRASLPSLGDTLRCACCFAPSGPGRPTAGLGFVIRSPCRKDTQGDKQGLPGSRTTRYPYALFFDPGRTEHVRPLRRVDMAPAMSTAKAPTNQSSFRGSIARLRDSLSTLRPMQLPAPDAKLASGRWPSATGRDWLPAGLLRKVSDDCHPPFPSFAWRKDILNSRRESRTSPLTTH